MVIVDKEIDLQLNKNFFIMQKSLPYDGKVAAKLYPDSVYPSFYQEDAIKKLIFTSQKLRFHQVLLFIKVLI